LEVHGYQALLLILETGAKITDESIDAVSKVFQQ
jgi:hypothetical protein